ncbi:MAG TPA: tetratricopeptide repeat protein, partial [Myxococcales bacterium]|nr:tetratricopeptide repeat protein [Myxococcales bacterium]
IVDNRARTTEDEQVKKWLNSQLGMLFWKNFSKPEKAEVYFRRVQKTAGQDEVVAEFYMEYYAKRGNWRRLEQLLGEQGLSELEIKWQLAELAEEQGKKDKALTFWQAVYKSDPSDLSIYERLRSLYSDLSKWHSLVELYKTRLSAMGKDDSKAAVALYLEMISIFKEHIKSDTKVISVW